MSIFGDDEDFELTPGGDEGAPKPAKQAPRATSPAPRGTQGGSKLPPRVPRPAAIGSQDKRPARSPMPKPSSPDRKSTLPPSPRQNRVPLEQPIQREVPRERVEEAFLPPAATQGYADPVVEEYEDYGIEVNGSHNDNAFGYEEDHSNSHYDQDILVEEDLPESISNARYEEPVAYYDDEEPIRSSRRSYHDVEEDYPKPITSSRRTPRVQFVEEDLYEDIYDDSDDEEVVPEPARSRRTSSDKARTKNSPKNAQRSKSPKEAKKARGKKKKGDSEEIEVSRFSGGRKKVLIVNGAVIAVVLSILGFGLNSILNPPAIPSQDDVKGLVSEQLNLTAFDKEGGRAFVSAFAREYFTIDPEMDADKAARLAAFTDEGVASNIATSLTTLTGLKQNISGEPQITNIRAIDDSNAIYNVGVKIGNKWVYIDVPVFYDARNLAYAVSDVPSFTPPPTVAKIGLATDEAFEVDAALTDSTQPNIESFFAAWTASDDEALGRYITGDANSTTRAGLQNTVYYMELKSYVVEAKEEADPTQGERQAIAEVAFGNTAKDPALTYTQTFELELYQQPDDRWYVADITPSETAYQPVELDDTGAPIVETE